MNQIEGTAAVSRRVQVGSEFRYTAEVETPAVFQVEPSRAGPATVVQQGWDITDLYGNDCQRVCRDFAHVAISFCRALSIPARYTFGYLPEMDVPPGPAPMDFAAWMEVYLDGRWWTFDPRNNTARKGRVVIGRGRDAVDVAMVTTYGGPLLQSMRVWADEAT